MKFKSFVSAFVVIKIYIKISLTPVVGVGVTTIGLTVGVDSLLHLDVLIGI